MKHVRTALIVIVALVFGYMLLGEFLLPANVPRSGFFCEQLPDRWVRVAEDGTRVPFTVPGHTDADITLETTLRGDFSKAVGKYLKTAAAEETTLYAPSASVLVVDDNDMNLDVIEGLLRDTKIRLDLVTSGRACIERVKQHKYDCILLDQMMPEMNGSETLQELRRAHLTGTTPIIALTADAIVGAREACIREGFTDYLSKPIKFEELEAALKKHLPPALQTTKDELERMTGAPPDTLTAAGPEGALCKLAVDDIVMVSVNGKHTRLVTEVCELNELNLRRQRNA